MIAEPGAEGGELYAMQRLRMRASVRDRKSMRVSPLNPSFSSSIESATPSLRSSQGQATARKTAGTSSRKRHMSTGAVHGVGLDAYSLNDKGHGSVHSTDGGSGWGNPTCSDASSTTAAAPSAHASGSLAGSPSSAFSTAGADVSTNSPSTSLTSEYAGVRLIRRTPNHRYTRATSPESIACRAKIHLVVHIHT